MKSLILRTVIFSFMVASSFKISAGDPILLSETRLMILGQMQYKVCAVCHGIDGKGTQYFAPALTNNTIATGLIYPLISVVIEGKRESKNNTWDAYMPAWDPVLNNNELASVITFIRNSLGNSVGDLVQPDNNVVLNVFNQKDTMSLIVF